MKADDVIRLPDGRVGKVLSIEVEVSGRTTIQVDLKTEVVTLVFKRIY